MEQTPRYPPPPITITLYHAHLMQTITQNAHAKLNLFLAVTGPRPDGFHNLVSLFVRLDLKDRLTLTFNNDFSEDVLTSNSEQIPLNKDNLVLKAAALFRKVHPFKEHVHFHLEKNIPVEAGLGGGSSDAVAALLALNKSFSNPLPPSVIYNLTTELGSDCPFFLEGYPAIVRGRGEIIEKVSTELKMALAGKSLLVFKPSFSISTVWAYNELKKDPRLYVPGSQAETFLNEFQSALVTTTSVKDFPAHLAINNFEKVVFKKFRALHQLSKELKDRFNVICHLCGSGSACYCFTNEHINNEELIHHIKNRLGIDIFCSRVDILT